MKSGVKKSVSSFLTIRNLPPEVATALERERQQRGTSLNRVVIDLLGETLGVGAAGKRSNGLAVLAGKWTAAEQAEFDAAVAETGGQIDDELWR